MKLGKTEHCISNSKPFDRKKLVEVDKKYAVMTTAVQRQVTTELEQQLDYLMGKKERQIMKKQKLKQMEELYQKQRSNKRSHIDLKISRSGKNRQEEISVKKAKSKKELERFDKVRKKVEHDNEEQLQKMLQLQKKLVKKRQSDSRSSRTSLNPTNSRQTKSFINRKRLQSKSIDDKIETIQSRMDHAKTNSKFYYSQISDKAKEHSKNSQGIIDQIKIREKKEEIQCISDYYKRATHIQQCGLKSKSFYQKESEKKKKHIQQKFTQAKRNLRQIDRQRQQKYQQLKIKFDKSFAPRTWRNEKNEAYLQKFMSNLKDIEKQKSIQAQMIVKKHLDMTLKHRALKQKKQKIHQTMKKIEI